MTEAKIHRDEIFNSERESISRFAFDADVATVFDDMVLRSIPMYAGVQEMMARLSLRFASQRPIVDLGCSTGTTIACMANLAHKPQQFVGVDNSPAMIEVAESKLEAVRTDHQLELACLDAEQYLSTCDIVPGVVIVSLIAQFIRPINRPAFIDAIYRRLDNQGAILLLEKIIDPSPTISAAYIEEYHGLKRRNGYSDLEIRQKREALENALIPFTAEENVKMLSNSGFCEISIFFSYLNFQGYLALKA